MDEIINQIKLNGYFSFEKAISNEALNEIEKMATESMLNFNQIIFQVFIRRNNIFLQTY